MDSTHARSQNTPRLDLDEIQARAEAATEGPWERGDIWRYAGVVFDDDGNNVGAKAGTRCADCHLGEPDWMGRTDINGTLMRAHKHRGEPYSADHLISGREGLVAGPYDYDSGGILDPADTEFIAHAREDIPALVAEVRRLRRSLAKAEEHVERNTPRMSENQETRDLRQRYEPFDQDGWLGSPPWNPDDPRLQAWEQAHGHDVRLKCYPEFGCLVIESSLERRAEAAERTLTAVRGIVRHTDGVRRDDLVARIRAILDDHTGDTDG